MSASKLAEQFIESILKPPLLHGDEAHQKWLADELRKQIPALDEMALRVFQDTRERAAKIAADAIAPNRRDIADAIRAMQPDGK